MKYLKFVFIVLLFSCSVGNKEFKKIKFNHTAFSSSSQEKLKYTMEVPKGYSLKVYQAGGEAGQSDEYWYIDSSVIYISDFGSSLNESNIFNAGYSDKKFEFSMKQNALIKDTLMLNGISERGYWKEILIGKVGFGYLNVPEKKREIFEKSLKTLQRKKG